jgi:hypothetical protein
MAQSKLGDAMAELKRDQFEISISDDPARLSEYLQIKAEAKRVVLGNVNRNETTGY